MPPFFLGAMIRPPRLAVERPLRGIERYLARCLPGVEFQRIKADGALLRYFSLDVSPVEVIERVRIRRVFGHSFSRLNLVNFAAM